MCLPCVAWNQKLWTKFNNLESPMSNFQDSIEIYWCQLHLIFTWQEKRARWQSRAAARAVETSMDLPTARAAVKATAKRMQVGMIPAAGRSWNVNVTWCRFFGANSILSFRKLSFRSLNINVYSDLKILGMVSWTALLVSTYNQAVWLRTYNLSICIAQGKRDQSA